MGKNMLKNLSPAEAASIITGQASVLAELEGQNRTLFEVIRDLLRANAKLLEENKELRAKQNADPLTGAFNRNIFTSYEWELFVSEIGRCPSSSVVVCMIDIDHFKQINDTYGHGTGDEVLVGVVKTIRQFFRRPSDFLIRMGGEEFLLAIHVHDNCQGPHILRRLENMHCQIGKRQYSTLQICTTVSIGVEVATGGLEKDNTMSMNNLIQKADAKLYRAKKTRNTLVSSDEHT